MLSDILQRFLSVMAFACLMYPSVAPAEERDQQQQDPSFAVVELFTSQGCSSCPRADELLTKIHNVAQEDERPVYVLSWHVDYWNRLGWKDPYSQADFSKRQRLYAHAAGSKRIYTPQMIVNGEVEFVGSNGKQAAKAITDALADDSECSVVLNAKPDGRSGSWNVEYKVTSADESDRLVVCVVADSPPNSVPRGENTGRVLAHTGVVRSFKTVELNGQQEGRCQIAWNDSQRSETSVRIIAFVQHAQSMRITGAAMEKL